jgi:site-specific recombinase
VPETQDPRRSYLESLSRALPASWRDDTASRGAVRRLARFITADTTGRRTDAWVDLVRWVRTGPSPPEGDAGATAADPVGATATATGRGRSRLLPLLDLVESAEETHAPFLDAVERMIGSASAVDLFAEAGIPARRGFGAEAMGRVMDRLIPQPRDEADLVALLLRIYGDDTAVRRFAAMPPRLFHRIVEVLAPAGRPRLWTPVREAFLDAFRLLATRVAALGLEERLRRRSGFTRVADSPFHRLYASSGALLDAAASGAPADARVTAWRRDVEACRAALAQVHAHLEDRGVDTGIVYSLEVISRSLARMERMVEILASSPGPGRSALLHRLLVDLAALTRQDHSLAHLVEWNTRLLQRAIVDRSAETGEHYIARDRKTYARLWLDAAGGGLVTTLTAALKLAISIAPMAPFAHGLLYGLNYAGTFVFMQHRHLVLATKQPAMTAAHLADILRGERREDWLEDMVDYTARISHSQIASAAANVLAVVAGAVVFGLLWQTAFGRPYLEPAYAAKVYASLSPINSGTVFYAALTGVILWLASLVGGWADNSSVYHRLPQAIAQHPLGDRLGRERLRRWGAAVERHMAGWATNISLGMMLGMTPALGHFFGLPLDVRHVTLNTGILAVAGTSLGVDWYHQGWFLRALAGVVVMFVLNLGVSFALSLLTAARAYDVPFADLAELARRIGVRLLRSPGDFLLPPRTPYRRHAGGDPPPR